MICEESSSGGQSGFWPTEDGLSIFLSLSIHSSVDISYKKPFKCNEIAPVQYQSLDRDFHRNEFLSRILSNPYPYPCSGVARIDAIALLGGRKEPADREEAANGGRRRQGLIDLLHTSSNLDKTIAFFKGVFSQMRKGKFLCQKFISKSNHSSVEYLQDKHHPNPENGKHSNTSRIRLTHSDCWKQSTLNLMANLSVRKVIPLWEGIRLVADKKNLPNDILRYFNCI